MRAFIDASVCRRSGSRILLAGVVVGLVLAPSSPARADDSVSASNPNIYALAAESVGIETVINDPSLPLNTTVDVGGYGASASLTSLGQSMADAGAPYSPYLYSLPGTVDGLSPNQLPYIPEPAGYVTSSYPTNASNTQAQGPYSISAQSQPSSSLGTVRLGIQQAAANDSTVQASAQTVANPDGSVHVQATTGVDMLNVGGLVDLGNVTSTETLDEKGSAAPTVTGSTNLGTVTLIGQPTGIVGGALDIFGAGVPIPLKTSILPLLNQLLAGAGVSVDYVPASYTYTDRSTSTGNPDPSKTIQAVESAGLRVTTKQNVRSQGLVTVTYTVGRVYVSAVDTAAPDLGSSLDSGSSAAVASDQGTSTGPTGDTASGVRTQDTGASTPGLSGAGATGSLSPSLATSAPGGSISSELGSAGTGAYPGAGGAAPSRMARVTLAGLSGTSFYLALILVALVVVGSAQVIRLLGVRLKPNH